MKKGVSTIIAEILILALSIGLLASFYVFYQDSTERVMKGAEENDKPFVCERSSNIVIDSVNGSLVFVKNTGGSIINASRISAYIEGLPVSVSAPDVLLKPGEGVNLTIGTTPASGDSLKIIGDCNSGDEIYIR